jgi:hypothetical protein
MPAAFRPSGGELTPGSGWVGRALVVVLGLNIGSAWLAIQGVLVLAQAVWLAAAGQVFAGAGPGNIADQIASLRLGQAALGLGAAALFVGWVHRVHRTLERLGVAGVLPARDSVKAVLTPGVNLVRIPSVVASLWRASATREPPSSVAVWVAWWWGLCLTTVVLDLSTVPPGRSILAPLGLGGGLPQRVLGECARIAAAVLTIVIVMRVERPLRDRGAAAARIRADG